MAHRRRTVRSALLVTSIATLVGAPDVGAQEDPLPPAPAVEADIGRSPEGRALKYSGSLAEAEGRISVFVRLTPQSAADAYDAALTNGRAAAKRAARAARAEASITADAVVDELQAVDGAATELYRTSNAVAAVAVVGDAADIRALAERPDVVRIARIVPKRLNNESAAVLTRVLQTWQDLGLVGEGMDVGIIDSGVDYTHANFGGPGTPEAFDAVDPTVAGDDFPTAKVVGGTDFAGETYDADSDDPAIATPDPDDNPLDCDGHGSHVAGTAAGYGVSADGAKFAGDYSALTPDSLAEMRIGPGMAPLANVYAVKVFGCSEGSAGSTDLVAAGLDWTLDPNQDGDFRDRLDVVNISIGADYSTPDDPDSIVTRALIDHGVMPIFSAGNGGDFYDIGAETPEALSVASSRDAFVLRDAIEVVTPPALAGRLGGQYSVALDYSGVDVTGSVVKLTDPANLDGCDPFSAADTAVATGKIVWLEWDDNDATRRCGSAGRSTNAFDAGAIGALFTSELEHFTAGITGHPVIPVFQMTNTTTDALRPALDAGTLSVRMAGDLATTLPTFDPNIVDTASSFTSRGTRTPGVKPDISAPGDTIVSTGIGSGNGEASISGTSMASPHTTGIAALVREMHPDWTPDEVKAALMNTAGHDIYSQDGQIPPIQAPNRVGAGRIDARAALENGVLAYDKKAPALVSVGFGVPEVVKPSATITRTIGLENKTGTPARYQVHYEAITDMPGVTYSLSTSNVLVPAFGTANVKVTLSMNRDQMRKVADPTITKLHLGFPRQFLADESGRVLFTPTSGASIQLRVPVHASPKPAAEIKVPKKINFAKGSETATLPITGRGLNQGAGDERYLSLLSVLQLAARSPALEPCGATGTTACVINGTARGGDLRYVGVGSTAPAAIAAGAPEESLLGFGIATWGNWVNLGENTVPFIDIDVDGDEAPDFEIFVNRDADTDLLEAWTADLDAGEIVDIEPVNQLYGDVDTNTFDTNVIVLPVSVEALGIDPEDASAPFDYFVGVDGFYTAADEDLIDFVPNILSFDPLNPGVWVQGAGIPALVHVAQPGTALQVHKDDEALADGRKHLLVLNLHNATGKKAQLVVLNIPRSRATPR
jgi:subtilisin family serine protease